ncbi:DKNYY domain-containing protein [Acinetobacter pseudolwoffii]|uniref:DKNYY domain-containing protein n=1 Tax=Acinetobacter pseudolwoffii TaxID=2053287 RepID=UPI003989452C
MSNIKMIGIALTILVLIYLFPPFTKPTLSKEERLAQFSPPGLITDYFDRTGVALVKNESYHFQKLNNQIYYFSPIPLARYGVPILEADVNSFKTLAQHFHWKDSFDQDQNRRKNIALDKNNVYCGFQKIPNLSPSRLIYLGGGYLTDHQNTYFCDWNFRASSDSIDPTLSEKIDAMLLGRKITKSGYHYPLYQLKNGKQNYKLIIKNIVTNGESTYVEGQQLKSTDPYHLRYLTSFQPHEKIWQENSYITDQKNVFYKHEILDLNYNDALKSIPFDFEIYLYDPLSDRYFYQSHKIDYPNLKIIKKDDNHTFFPIFTSEDQIAFFNTQKLQLEVLNKNPFISELHRLSPSVFSNGKHIYFFRKYQTFSSTLFMFFSELCSTTSEIRMLNNMPFSQWKKEEDLFIQSPLYKGIPIKGSFWTYGDRLFYLPEYGSWTESMFEVRQSTTIDQLRKNQLSYTQAEELLKNPDIFKSVKGKTFSKIKDIQRFCFKNIFS